MKKTSKKMKPVTASKAGHPVQSKEQTPAIVASGIKEYLTKRRKMAPKPRPEDLGPTTSTGRVQQHS